MGRSVLSEKSILDRLFSLGCSDGYDIGLILGQNLEKEDYIIHLARTPPPRTKNVVEETLINSAGDSEQNNYNKCFKSIWDVPESWVADHAKDITRLLPGGMRVLGIFVAGPVDILQAANNVQKLRLILMKIQKNLSSNEYLYGTNEKENLILNFSSTSQRYVCKSVDNIKTGSLKSVDIKFRPYCVSWIELETIVNLDQMFGIALNQEPESLKEQLEDIVEHVSNVINSALVVISGEVRSSDNTIETIITNKKEIKSLNVDLYIPCKAEAPTDIKITPCSTSMWLVGQLISKTFVTHKTNIAEASAAIKQDIIRSLASRLEMHWDSLIEEENGSPEENITLHEPPRKILIDLVKSRITFSSYLFPGEEPQEALVSLQELLDVDVQDLHIKEEIEHQAEPTDSCACGMTSTPVNPQNEENGLNTIHVAGLVTALVIFVAAVILHQLY